MSFMQTIGMMGQIAPILAKVEQMTGKPFSMLNILGILKGEERAPEAVLSVARGLAGLENEPVMLRSVVQGLLGLAKAKGIGSDKIISALKNHGSIIDLEVGDISDTDLDKVVVALAKRMVAATPQEESVTTYSTCPECGFFHAINIQLDGK